MRRAAVLLVFAVLAAIGAGRASAAHRLNVVFIVSDDENISGNAVMKDVNRLIAKHGVTFDNFRVTTSECGPSRASILSGQYSHHTGVTDNFGLHGYPSFDAETALPVWLHDAGYQTALVGKYLNDYSLDGHNAIPPGWSDWQAMDSVPLEKYYDYTVNENGKVVHYGTQPDDYSTTVLTQKAIDFLDRVRSPFFLYYAPVAPHLPAVPAPEDVGRFDKLAPFASPSLNASVKGEPWAAWHAKALTPAGLSYTESVRRHQLEALQSVDRAVGRIVATLIRRHLLDRTVIFYTSDNGFLWGEHRLGGKLWPYEESTRVPLVVRTPWTTANGTVNHDAVLNIDFASTIAALTHVTPAIPQDGDSFASLLHGRPIAWRKDYLIEYLGQNKLRDGGPPPYVAIHTQRYLYVEYRYKGWQELYDLRTDPWELHNVIDEPAYSSIRLGLRQKLNALYAAPPHRGL
ncbi:MAG TPA: sulfatase [Gaiellaceae bacterium]|nr:sulfatase [Gaiellaceae bacterium]